MEMKNEHSPLWVFLFFKRRMLIMATNSEDNILYQCIKCNHKAVLINGVDGNECNYCGGHLNALCYTNLPATENQRIDIDCSSAIKGLKALQRETKKAIGALKELEGHKENFVIFDEIHRICPNCGGTDFETTEMEAENGTIVSCRIECMDCGYCM